MTEKGVSRLKLNSLVNFNKTLQFTYLDNPNNFMQGRIKKTPSTENC